MKIANESVNIKDLQPELIAKLLKLEELLGYEITITSGYRSTDHSIEAAKATPGAHTTGLAVDIASVGGTAVFEIVRHAITLGFRRIGVNRKKNFCHIDLDPNRHSPALWTY